MRSNICLQCANQSLCQIPALIRR